MKKQRKPNAKQRELAADWEKLLDRHSKPLVTKPMRPSFGSRNPAAGISGALAFHADRVHKPSRPTVEAGRPEREVMKETLRKQLIEEIGIEEYQRREAEAAEKASKRCVMPMHKSNYVVVADPEIVKMMGKKVV
jgi:hypothetical protein